MTSREMLIAFEEYIRNTNPDLEFDVNINTDVVFQFLTRAEEEYIDENFLIGDSLKDQINAVRKRSDVLRNLIKRCAAKKSYVVQNDGGYLASFGTDIASPVLLTDYWLFLSGVLLHNDLPVTSKGYDGADTTGGIADNSTTPKIELELINHYDLQKKVRTVNNEPVYKYIPIVLEGPDSTATEGQSTGTFAFYLDREQYIAMSGSINNTEFHINYLARPTPIDLNNGPSLASSTHNAIVAKAAETFIVQYKSRLGINTTKDNG